MGVNFWIVVKYIYHFNPFKAYNSIALGTLTVLSNPHDNHFNTFSSSQTESLYRLNNNLLFPLTHTYFSILLRILILILYLEGALMSSCRRMRPRKWHSIRLQTVLSRIFVYCHLESNSYYSPNVSRGHLPKGCTIDCSLIIPLSMVDHIIFSFCGYVWLETQFSQEDFEFFLECNCPLQLSPQIFSKWSQ